MRERFRGALGDNPTEKRFYLFAVEAGFLVLQSQSFTSPYPVENKHGELRKIKTRPDFRVVDPQSGRDMYVEVTSGAGKWKHKDAQRMVMEAVGVTNYTLVDGGVMERLINAIDAQNRRAILLSLFCWAEAA